MQIYTPQEVMQKLSRRFKDMRLRLRFTRKGLAQRAGVSVGSQGMGALSYEPERSNYTAADKALQLDALAEACHVILSGETDQDLDELLSLNRASAGARPKIIVDINQDKTWPPWWRAWALTWRTARGTAKSKWRGIGADFMISSSLVRLGRSYRLQLNLFETATGTMQRGREVAGNSLEELADGIGTPAGELAAIVLGVANG